MCTAPINSTVVPSGCAYFTEAVSSRALLSVSLKRRNLVSSAATDALSSENAEALSKAARKRLRDRVLWGMQDGRGVFAGCQLDR